MKYNGKDQLSAGIAAPSINKHFFIKKIYQHYLSVFYQTITYNFNLDTITHCSIKSKTSQLLEYRYSLSQHCRYGLRFSVKQRINKKPLSFYRKMTLALLSLLLLPYPMTSQAALSISTANTIQGEKPFFTYDGVKIENLDNLVGFNYTDSSGNTIEIDKTKSLEANATNELIIPAGIKVNTINPTISFVDSGINLDTVVKTAGHSLKVADADGDASVLSQMGAKGIISVSMEKDGNLITPGNTEFDPCSDYQLTISITASGTPASVSAMTQYGDPNDSGTDYSPITATYKLKSEVIKMCYLAPLSLAVRPSSSAIYGSSLGYTSLWAGTNTLNSKGFIVDEMESSGKKFPQTGFKGARFKVVGSGSDQSNYECKLSSTSGVKQSPASGSKATGKNCLIEYLNESKPTSGFSISLYYNPISTSVPVQTYTMPVPQFWAKVKSRVQYNTAMDYTGTYSGAILCGAPAGLSGIGNQSLASSYFLKRNEITNARNASVAPAAFQWLVREYFIRDVSLTAPSILGEWGDLYSGLPYPNSGIRDPDGLYYLWASEEQSSTQQFRVNGVTGNIYTGLDPSDTTYTPLVVCRVN